MSVALERGLRVDLRANVSADTVGQLDLLRREAERRGWRGFPGFSLHPVAVQFCEGVDEAARGYAAERNEAIDGGAYRREVLRDAFRRRDFYPLKPYYCGAHGYSVAVDCFGDLYACWGNALGNPRCAIGRLDEENGVFAFDGRRRAWLDSRPDRRAECRACPYVFLCGGGCPMDLAGGTNPCEGERRRIQSHLTALGREICAEGEGAELAPLTRSYQDLFHLLNESELAPLRAGAVPGKIRWLFSDR